MQKRFLFITANGNETSAFLSEKEFFHFKPNVCSDNPDDDSFYNVGKIGEHFVIHFELQAQGSLKTGASLSSVYFAIDFWKPDAVILIGIAFGKDNEDAVEPRQHIGDVLISTMLADYESGKMKSGALQSDAASPDSG